MTGSPQLALVVAMGTNGAIGRENALLWRLRTDMRRFRELTMGHPLIMGRKTWDSIGKALPGRNTIVLTRNPDFAAPGVLAARDLAEARDLASVCAKRRGVSSAMVVGGAEIYAATLPLASRIHLTLVDDAPEADAFFPGGPDGPWRRDFVETGRQAAPAGPDDEKSFVFIDLARREGVFTQS